MNHIISNIIKIIDNIKVVKGDNEQNIIDKIMDGEGVRVISFINAHGINLCYHNFDFVEAMISSDLILRDGIGMNILFRFLDIEPGKNMNGTDFIPKILEKCKGKRILLLGTKEPFLGYAVKNLKKNGHIIVGHKDGFQGSDYYLEFVKKYGPEVIILGMGMPKQELLALSIKENYSRNCIIINGGAIIDRIGGKVNRAPKLMQSIGLEWAYRLILEPIRLFKRYIIGNPLFLYRLLKIKKTRKLTE